MESRFRAAYVAAPSAPFIAAQPTHSWHANGTPKHGTGLMRSHFEHVWLDGRNKTKFREATNFPGPARRACGAFAGPATWRGGAHHALRNARLRSKALERAGRARGGGAPAQKGRALARQTSGVASVGAQVHSRDLSSPSWRGLTKGWSGRSALSSPEPTKSVQ